MRSTECHSSYFLVLVDQWFESCCHPCESSVASGRASGQNCYHAPERSHMTKGQMNKYIAI